MYLSNPSVLISLMLASADAFTSSRWHGTTWGSVAGRTSASSIVRMAADISDVSMDPQTVENLEKIFEKPLQPLFESIDDAESQHGMPWKSSIDANVQDELLYMPFWKWHMSFMKESLTNLRVMPCSNDEYDFSYKENTKKKARIANLCLASDEYRKIRMSYYDAGDNTQVYNAVLYPHATHNLPILGIDLLAFNRKKYLAIVDFQPIHDDEEDHATMFEERLRPIKAKYDALKGKMSARFYDETKFFSQEMLFARFEDENVITDELLPAFQAYVKEHLNILRGLEPNTEEFDFIMERQKEYDCYSASRDPATGLFAAMFGNDWAENFVHDFLFSMSERKEGESIIPQGGPMGGPPRGRGGPPSKGNNPGRVVQAPRRR